MDDRTDEPLPAEEQRKLKYARKAKIWFFVSVFFLLLGVVMICCNDEGPPGPVKYPIGAICTAGFLCNSEAIVHGVRARLHGVVWLVEGVLILPLTLLVFLQGLFMMLSNRG